MKKGWKLVQPGTVWNQLHQKPMKIKQNIIITLLVGAYKFINRLQQDAKNKIILMERDGFLSFERWLERNECPI
ncbi:hypothetical protein B1NLA3E_11945 [Bacillus sp. 1NLA3E]|nr:hypothetical protein B1NLA3E_11945 [Bacillus sp. 1NLA3E]